MKIQKINMSEYIPFEIQAEILKRLPTKPLLQFRSVSKSYKCLIDSPDFIVSYSVDHPRPGDRFILRYERPKSFKHKYLTFVDNDGDHGFIQQEFIHPLPKLIRRIRDFSYVAGSSHGLLCFAGFYHETQMVVLWNPSIRKSVGIRVPYVYETLIDNIWDADVFGFGVCPVTFDPTIIRIKSPGYQRKNHISVPWKVHVFTLSTGTWSIISTNLPRDSIRLKRSHVVIDRVIYWVAYDYDMCNGEFGQAPSSVLIMFDLAAKEFKEINLIDCLENRRFSVRTISKLQESLVLLEYHRESEQDRSICCCLWMMKEQGVNRSFTKLYTIKLPDASIRQILGFRKTGDLILATLHKRDANVQIYKQNHEYAENLGIYGKEHSFFMCSYMESLLLLDKSDGYVYCSKIRI